MFYIFTEHCCHHRFSWSWPQWWYRKTSGGLNEPHARILNDGVVKIWWCYYGIIIERAMVTEWILCQNLSENLGLMRSPGCNNSIRRENINRLMITKSFLVKTVLIALELFDCATLLPNISIFHKAVDTRFLPLSQVLQCHGTNPTYLKEGNHIILLSRHHK